MNAPLERDPYGEFGARSPCGSWHYQRERGTWKVYLDVPNILEGEPYDGSMVGTAVLDNFGVLRVVGSLK